MKNLPVDLDATVRAQLASEFIIPASLSQTMKDAILDAYMKGMRDVFIFYLPVVALCLLSCFLIKVGPFSPPLFLPLPRY